MLLTSETIIWIKWRGVRLGIEAGTPSVAHDIPHYTEHDSRAEQDDGEYSQIHLPCLHVSVVQHKQSHGQTSDGSTQVTHEPGSVVWIVESHVDCKSYVMHCQQADEDDADDLGDGFPHHLPDPDGGVLLPVDDHGGEVSCYQSVASSTCSCQVCGTVCETGAETSSQYSRHVDQQHLVKIILINNVESLTVFYLKTSLHPTLLHLQRDSNNYLENIYPHYVVQNKVNSGINSSSCYIICSFLAYVRE